MHNCLSILKTLFNTSDERHAFVVGFSETFAIRQPFIKLWPSAGYTLRDEYHYYVFGRATGVLAWVGIAIGIIKIWR